MGEAGAYAVGDRLDVSDEVNQWHEAVVMNVNATQDMLRLHLEGWPHGWDEWVASSSTRLRPLTGRAGRGPTSVQWAGAPPLERPRASGAAASSEDGAGKGAGAAAGAASGRRGGRGPWFRRSSGAVGPRRAASEKADADAWCPSGNADFYPTLLLLVLLYLDLYLL